MARYAKGHRHALGDEHRARILTELKAYIRTNGYSPTVRELAATVGLGSSTVHRHLETLMEDGKVDRGGGLRTWRAVD